MRTKQTLNKRLSDSPIQGLKDQQRITGDVLTS